MALHARRRPDHVAVVSDGVEVTYATLHRQIEAVTASLRLLHLPPGALAMLAHPDIHQRLLALLACERLGVTAAPFRADEGAALNPLLAQADVVLSAEAPAAADGRRWVRMDAAWFAAALQTPQGGAAERRPEPDDAVLLVRSSGSTGRQKQMLVTRANLDGRLAKPVRPLRFGRGDRFLAMLDFTVAVVIYRSLLCLRLGATIVADRRHAAEVAIRRHRPTQLYVMQYQLAALVAAGDADSRLPDLTIVVGGGRLPAGLRDRALARLCGRVLSFYGANESGIVATVDEASVATPLPGLEVVIRQSDGAVPRADATGEICIRGATVVQAYHRDPEATAASFRDGWWHSGDYGGLTTDGRIVLLGRRDDMLNFAGMKVAAVEVEAVVTSFGLPLADLAVLGGRTADGRSVGLVCVVTERASVTTEVARRLSAAIPGVFAVSRVASIPRSADGKVLRAQLHHRLRRRPAVQSGAYDRGPDPAAERDGKLPLILSG